MPRTSKNLPPVTAGYVRTWVACFGRPVKEPLREDSGEPVAAAAPSALPPAFVRADAELLLELKRFLDVRIVQPSQNGVKKLPLLVINEATRLSIALSKRIDRLFPTREA